MAGSPLGPDEKCRAMIEKIRGYAKEAGRDPDAIGIEGLYPYGQGAPEAYGADWQAWNSLGATHASFNTMKAGLNSPAHLHRSPAAIQQSRDVEIKAT